MTAALTVDRVSFWPRGGGADDALVADISFSVGSGECIALVGPNGAGKTTLIRMVAGLAQPSRGAVYLNGTPIHTMSFAERARQIAYVGQSDEPDGRLLVRDYVALGLVPHRQALGQKEAIERAESALATAGVANFRNRRLDQLSGGERQRAKIARAMCQRPTLLILDEPTNHLDPQARGEQLSLVAAMGIPVVAALHDLTLIDAFSDQVAILADGRLHAFGPPADMLSTATVRSIFGVDLHRLRHPAGDYDLPTLDIPLSRALPGSPSNPVQQTRLFP